MRNFIVLSVLVFTVSNVAHARLVRSATVAVKDNTYVGGSEGKGQKGETWCLCEYSQSNDVSPAPAWHYGKCNARTCGAGYTNGREGVPPVSGR